MGPEWGTGTSELVETTGPGAPIYLAAICYVENIGGSWTEAVVSFNAAANSTGSAWDAQIAGVHAFPDLCTPGTGSTPSGLLTVREFVRCTAAGSCSLYDYPSLTDFKANVLGDVAERTGIALSWLQANNVYLESDAFTRSTTVPNGCGSNCPPAALDDTWNEVVSALPNGGSSTTAAWIHAEKKDSAPSPPTRVIRQVTVAAYQGLPAIANVLFQQKPAGTSLAVDAWLKARYAQWAAGSTYSRIVMKYLGSL
jgi:hypothetical protein